MSDESRDPKASADDQWLDRMLDAAPPVEPSAALRRAVAEIPLRHPRPAGATHGGFGWPAYALRVAMVAALAAVAVGAWLGSQADVLPEIALSDDASATQLDDEWEELALLAFADDLDAELGP